MDSNVIIKIDALDKSKPAFQSLNKSLNKVQERTKGFRSKLESMQPAFQKMALAGGAAFAGVSLGINRAKTAATSLNESINAVNVVFGEGADNILDFGKNSAQAVGLATSQFNQMSTVTGALLKDTGLSMDEVANQTISLTERAADMASVFNTSVSDAMSAINQALRGETEAIRRYAGDVTDATLETFLLSQGINKSVTEMTEQEKRLYRVQLIMEQTSMTADDFQNTIGSVANQERVMAATTENAAAKLGNTLIPIFKSAYKAISPILIALSEWIEKNPKLARNIIIATAALTGLVAVVGALGLLLPPIIVGFGLLFSPVTLVIGAIAALAAGVYFMITRWEQFKALVTGIWNSLPNFVKIGVQTMLAPLLSTIKVIQMIVQNWQTLQTQFKSGVNFLIGLAESFANSWVGAINKVIDALNSIDVSIPSWVPKIGGNSFGIDLPKIGSISIPRLADGGIVTRSTIANIGEAGPEAVIPLNRAGGLGNVTVNITGNSFMGEDDMAERVGDKIVDLYKLGARV